ncbi:endolytic transglycosylase MltG [Rhodoblastus sp.]|uniref:endolytic transglycosylase MltG n=1 Tax=Rhodoblastus sp. TaxID=1962975 RepID=UPI0035B41AB8
MSDEPEEAGLGVDDTPKSARPEGAGASLFGRRGARSPSEALHPEAAPPPPPEKKRKPSRLGAISGFLTFLLALAILAGIGVVFADRAVRAPGPLAADKVVYIQQGSDSDQIIDQLQTQGVIDSPFLFTLTLFVEGARSKLKAGEYLFKQNASLQEVIDALVSGKAILHSLTIPEGLTSQQIVERLRESEFLVGDIRETPREGSLLPETYKFQRGDSRDKLLQKMVHDQKALLDEIWRRRASDLPLASPYELVTLASIVEKETGKADERPRVAAVFINRLRKHMRLQSDPTIVYGLVGGQGPLGRPLTRADIDAASAYNTYVIDGLPPGPIANPGRAAMEAVANPSRTQDLYFVADGTGGHVFADSLDAHNRNVQRWRQIEQTNKPKGPAQPGGAQPAAPGAPQAPAGATIQPPPATPPARDKGAWLGPYRQYGFAPTEPEFAVRHQARAPSPARLNLDPDFIARVAPVLPGASPAPVRLADFIPAQSGVGGVQFAQALGDVQLGGVTQAENNLDGPAEDTMAPGAPNPAERGGRTTVAAADLDGPAAPVETSALGNGGGAIANAAPNGKPRIYDAAEGTPLDPLLNKSWDLNSAKSVDLPGAKPDAPSKSRN